MKKLIIKVIQIFTSNIQIKGIPKILLLIKKPLFDKNKPYECYNKIKIKINPNVGFHCLNVLNYGGYETIKLFEKYLCKGDTYVDVGTNFGYMSINAKQIVGDNGHVFSFEPDKTILPLLYENIKLNTSKINIIEKGVSNFNGSVNFKIATESGLSRIENVKRNNFGLILKEETNIEVVKLDSYFENYRNKINFIKIDVEGHEVKILEGSLNILKKYKPLLMLEINPLALLQNENNLEEIYNFLDSLNYKIFCINSHSADVFRIGRNPTLIEINRINIENYLNKSFDLFAI